MHKFVIGKFGKIYLADDEPLDIIGKCNVHIKTINGFLWKLPNVRFVLGLRRNLISIGKLDNTLHKTIFGDYYWKIVKGAMILTGEQSQEHGHD